jgi:hypothetical protein
MTDLMTCAQAETLLADWLDETLDPRAAQVVGAHVRACSHCSALLAALDVQDADAAALPQLQPSRDLWAGIEARIQTPVVELATRPSGGAMVVPRRFGWVAQAAAAVALVTVTAGTTWIYAGRTVRHAVTRNVIAGMRDGYTDAGLSRLPGRAAMRAVGAEGALPAIERTYDVEIGALRGILAERRNELDPKTLAVLEKNLKVIDDAIAQSRQALQRDPANTGLGDQLAGTLDQKLQLLRTAALLPPRA